MARFLNNEDVKSVLTMEIVLEALEKYCTGRPSGNQR